ncbi:MAG TPA: DUF2231 domain-containing protein [Devosia sp.]|jgi:uncharacterized membrane protein|uniref:DUF2231 domain-containing protein n=1 Tax=Devosia sp. TaxID=1871048 RepID=UPI002F9289CD
MAQDLRGLSTTAQIGGHPLHPMLIPLPIGLLVGTFACDLAFWGTGDTFWASAAFWALVGALVTAAIAAVAGFMDFFGNSKIRAIKDAWRHMVGNLVAVVLAVVSLWLRASSGAQVVLPWGLLLSTLVVVLILYTGWKGGELSYRHRVGMLPDDRT